jgi:hypothetical protein
MNFESTEQHSLQQLQYIRELIQKHHQLTRQMQAWLVVQLVQHGWPKVHESIKKSRDQARSVDLQIFLDKLLAQTYVVNEIPDWSSIRTNTKIITPYYRLNGYLYFPGNSYGHKLVIIFSTMYNNFYLSNAIVSSLLASWGVSVLLLKNATQLQYLNGVQGLGDNLFKVSEGISKIIEQEKIQDVYILGFSSGGYGSLFLSTQIPCNAYLGFSIHTHLADRAKFPVGKFLTPEVLSKAPSNSLLNLRDVIDLEKSKIKRTIVYGDNSRGDQLQALNLQGCDGVELIGLPNCGHATVAKVIENKTFIPMLRKLIFSTAS